MADRALVQSSGGTKKTAVAAGTGTADVVVSALPGRLNRLVVTTAATSAVSEIHDHATASGSGREVYISADNLAVGDVLTFDIPMANGIVVKQVNNSAALTVYYTEDLVTGAVTDKAELITNGGQFNSKHAAGSSGAGAALATPGRLCKISVITSGSAATLIYDNASAASGTLLYSVKANPTVGTVIDLNLPCANGIYVAGATNTSALCVTYNKSGAYGKA